MLAIFFMFLYFKMKIDIYSSSILAYLCIIEVYLYQDFKRMCMYMYGISKCTSQYITI